MPKRNAKRDAAKAEYIARKSKGETVNLRELAEQLGVGYQLLRNWKAKEKWDDELPAPKKKRGGQPGNRNSAGKKNAAGSHDGAPQGNKNAEKDGAYSTVLLDMLTPDEMAVANAAPMGSKEALVHEMQVLKVRENRILKKIAQYEAEDEDTLHISSLLDMRVPAGKGNAKVDGANQTMGMYSKDSAFSRIMKLQEALYKVQGRIATIINTLRAIEENEQRLELEKQRIEIMRIRATGEVLVDEPSDCSAEADHFEEGAE